MSRPEEESLPQRHRLGLGLRLAGTAAGLALFAAACSGGRDSSVDTVPTTLPPYPGLEIPSDAYVVRDDVNSVLVNNSPIGARAASLNLQKLFEGNNPRTLEELASCPAIVLNSTTFSPDHPSYFVLNGDTDYIGAKKNGLNILGQYPDVPIVVSVDKKGGPTQLKHPSAEEIEKVSGLDSVKIVDLGDVTFEDRGPMGRIAIMSHSGGASWLTINIITYQKGENQNQSGEKDIRRVLYEEVACDA